MIRTFAALLLIVPLAAQDPPAQRGRRPFDEVVAIIGDRVVLRSTLEREIELRGGGELPREAHDQLQQEVVLEFVRDEIWIQHGKSIGEQAPAKFEETLDRLVNERIKEDIRASGSFTRYEEGLDLLGRSWEDVRRRERDELLMQLAQGDKMSQLQRSQGLLVTPAEMRRFYDENIAQFVRPATYDVAWVGFEVDGDDHTAVHDRVETAARAWRAEDLTSAQIAERFGGTDLGVKRWIRLDESDTRAEFLKAFAGSHEVGAVSAPIPRGAHLALLRLVAVHRADSREFTDPEVQALIRRQLAIQRTSSWQNEVLARKQRKIYLWPPTLNLAR